jgi:hypothetical protein
LLLTWFWVYFFLFVFSVYGRLPSQRHGMCVTGDVRVGGCLLQLFSFSLCLYVWKMYIDLWQYWDISFLYN